MVLEKALENPLDCKESNQSILKAINPEYSLEGLMLKLKLQYFGHLMWRASWLEKTLMLGKIECRRRRAWQDEIVWWHHWLNGHKSEPIPRDGEGQGSLACYSPWSCKESDTTERLTNNCLDSFGCCIFLSQVSSPPNSSFKKQKQLFILDWNIASERCCDNFRWTAKGLSHTYTCIHSPLASLPVQAAKQCWAGFPVLYSRSLLVIHVKYTRVYKSVLSSSWIAPYPCKESLPARCHPHFRWGLPEVHAWGHWSSPLCWGLTGLLPVPELKVSQIPYANTSFTFCSQFSLLTRAPNQSLVGKKGADTMLFFVSSLIILSRQVKQKSCSSFCQKIKPNQTSSNSVFINVVKERPPRVTSFKMS